MSYLNITPVITEKTSLLLNNYNQYVFYIPQTCNKIIFSNFISSHYGVTVSKVNILNVKGKVKNRPKKGRTSDRKKAIVSLASGQKIDAINKLF